MPRSIVLALISFLVLSAGSKSAVAAETCPISPNPDAPSWCTLGIGWQFTAVVRQGEKTDTPLPVNYRICMAKPNELTTPEYATHVFYGISMNASSPLPQSATLHSGELLRRKHCGTAGSRWKHGIASERVIFYQ